MSKHISTMILWILIAGILLYGIQHLGDLWSAFTHLTKGGSLKGLFQSINTVFK